MRACPSCHAVYAKDADRCGLDGARLEAPSADPLRGRVLGKYRLEALLGAGTHGLVYRAEEWEANRTVAVRVLFGEAAVDRRVVQRFRQRVEAASRVRHLNLVEILDFGLTAKGVPFVATELLKGHTIRAALTAQGRMPPERVAFLGRVIALGIAEAHRAGISHGHLTVGKVVLEDVHDITTPKVIDLGLSASENTPTLDDDVFAMGALLYEMLAGHPPFIGSRDLAGMKSRAPEMPEDGEPLLDLAIRLLDRDARARPVDAQQVSLEIHRAYADDPKTVLARPFHSALQTPRLESSTSEPEVTQKYPAQDRSRALAASDAVPTVTASPAREMTPTKRTVALVDAGASSRPPLVVGVSARVHAPPSIERSDTGMIDDQPDEMGTLAREVLSTPADYAATPTYRGEKNVLVPEPEVERSETRPHGKQRPASPSYFVYAAVCGLGVALGVLAVYYNASRVESGVDDDPALERAILESVQMAQLAESSTVTATRGRAVLVIDWQHKPRAFKLLVDGLVMSTTARVFELDPGEHEIEVVPNTGSAQRRSITVVAGKSIRVVIVMRQGTSTKSPSRTR